MREFRRPGNIVDEDYQCRHIGKQLQQGLLPIWRGQAVQVVLFRRPYDLDPVRMDVVEGAGDDAAAGIGIVAKQWLVCARLTGDPGQAEAFVQGVEEVLYPDVMRHWWLIRRSGWPGPVLRPLHAGDCAGLPD